MAGNYDPNVIPDLGVQLPPGNALLRIDSLDDSEATNNGKYQIKATLRVHEPVEFADMPHFERFVIGTDKDLEANDPVSWRGFAAQRYRDMLLKAGVALTGKVETDNAVATGQMVGAVIENEVQGDKNRDGSPNKYAGNINARIKSFFRVGEKATGAGAPTPAATGAAKPPAAAKPAANAAKPQAAPGGTVPCGICDQQVPKAEYIAHITKHQSEE